MKSENMKKLSLLVLILIGVMLLSADISDRFVDAVTSNNFVEAESYYSPALAEALQIGKLEIVWQGILRSTGDFEVVVEKQTQQREEFTSVVTTLKFENIYMDMVMTVDKNDQLSGLFFRPSDYTGDLEVKPDYVSMDNIVEEEVEFDCNGFTMHGSLVVPHDQRSFPIVIMATGSGPNDRDEKIGANKPFKNIAHGLGNLGVATLRYEKRTFSHPDILSRIPDFNIDHEYTEEIAAAIEFLATKYQGRKVYYLGHSMGAFMAPRVLKENPELEAAIMLAANARPLEDLVLEQTEYIMIETDTMNALKLALLEKSIKDVKKLKNLKTEVEEPMLLGLSKEYWLSLNNYKLIKEAKALTKPVLVLQGERDYQVTTDDYDIWFENFGKSRNWHFILYPDLNHLFMSGTGKSLPKEYMSPNFVSEQVINDISRFVLNIENGN